MTTWYGSFLIDEGGDLLDSRPFPRSAQEIAERLRLVRDGEVLDEERALVPPQGGVGVEEERLLALPGAFLLETGAGPVTGLPSPKDLRFDVALLREASLDLATSALREALPPDQPVVLLLRAMDIVDREASRGAEMLTAWHSYHFPELPGLVSTEAFLRVVREHPDQRDILAGRPDLDLGPSAGRPLSPGEGEAMAGMAAHILASREEAQRLRGMLEEAMERTAPNLTVVAGPLVGARLISLAGSLERLARMPSSTVQLLGAERALFLHIKEGAPAPKHGVLFQHPSVHSAPPWLRGRAARTLAGKVAIAARADTSGTHPDGGLGRELRDVFLQRVQELRRRNPQAPPGWKRRGATPRQRGRGEGRSRPGKGGRGGKGGRQTTGSRAGRRGHDQGRGTRRKGRRPRSGPR